MESYRTEEEQVEALKRWWKDNGTSTLVVVLFAVAAGFGWQGWQARQQAQAEAASTLFQQFLETAGAEAGGDAAAAETLATRLASEYDGTAYARFAELHLARLHVAGGDLGAAEAALRTVLAETSPKADLHRVAKLRLGRVLAASGDTDDALALLASDANNPYAGAYALARGDVLFAAGREDEAGAAYREAQSLADPARPLPGVGEKLDYLNPRPPAAGGTG